MYISKVEFDAVRLAQAGLYQSGRYAEHQWLWLLFSDSPQRKRDFVYRYMKASHDDGANAPHFLVVSEREPETAPICVVLWSSLMTRNCRSGIAWNFPCAAIRSSPAQARTARATG